MRKAVIAALIALSTTALITLPGCSEQKHHTAKPTKKSVEVYHFADGRYGYRGDDGMWWYYMAASQNTSTTSSSSYSSNTGGRTYAPSGGSIAPAAPVTTPSTVTEPSVAPAPAAPAAVSERGGFGSMGQQFSGGQWSKGPAPTEEELQAAGEPEQLEMDFGPEGQPLSEEQAQEMEAQAEQEATSEGVSTTVETHEDVSPTESTSESSTSEGSSSSDSGGGDSGGGGDGGGGD